MKKTQIQLSDHFTYQKLLRFVLPSIVMMVFTSICGVVDGLFVSNFAGKTPFAAINLVMPLTKTQLAGRTLTPIPPPGGKLTVELRHKPETHVGAAVCSAAWGSLCQRVRLYRLTAHPCAGLHYANAASTHRGGVRNKNARDGELDLLFGCVCGNRVC